MSELRQDPTTEEWVIVATDRAKRPHDLSRPQGVSRGSLPYDESCPFCHGNEAQTPPEIARYVALGGHRDGWDVRVVPNKFPALTPEGTTERRKEGELFRHTDGIGVHEVIVENSRHDLGMADMDEAQLTLILRAYRDRYNALKTHPYWRFITIFRNYGESAGTTLEHPHSQLIATPIAPTYLRKDYDLAFRYYDTMGRCLYCDLLRAELADGRRVVAETECFLVFHPYASRLPFETWISPKEHQPSFGLFPEAMLGDLAKALKTTLLDLKEALNDPDYNYAIHTAPAEDEEDPYYDWHIRIVPRLTIPAGFEMGSGIYINTASPEQTAEFMRSRDQSS